MILLIDNYDSFSYNLFQLIGELLEADREEKKAEKAEEIKVIRNDELSVSEIYELAPSHIIISPGPGKPSDAGICEELVRKADGSIPILGVCLGHQAICEAVGGQVSYACQLMHGKQSVARKMNESRIFEGLPEKFMVGRYHSLSAVRRNLPDTLRITSESYDGEIMSVEHTKYPIFGLQFHPESILTPDGKKILKNFLEM